MKKNHALRVALKKLILLHWPKIINSRKRNDNETGKKHAARKFSTPPTEMHYSDKASGWVKNYQYACLMLFSLLFLFIVNRGWVN